MNLIVTIDTEEDNWNRYSREDNPVKNISKIPVIQDLFDRYGVKPTYLITYPVATNPSSVAILKSIVDEGKCEIGMHCHPWNTPPFDKNSPILKRDTWLCNLPEDLIHEKLTTLHEAISKNFQIEPVSFRAGRWAFSAAVARGLCKLGYKVDTSVSPFIDWTQMAGPDFSDFDPSIFRFDRKGVEEKKEDGELLEVPATVGFLQKNFQLCRSLYRLVHQPWSKKMHLLGILDRLRLLNLTWLSPEREETSRMMTLAKHIAHKNYPCVNLTFHSTSLYPGLSPFAEVQAENNHFHRDVEKFLDFARKAQWRPVTLAEFESQNRLLAN